MSSVQNNYPQAFFESFVIGLLLTLSPSKALGFAIPLICIVWFIYRSRSGNTFKRVLFVLLGWGVLMMFYSLYNYYFGWRYNISNGIVSFIHYASLLFIVVFPAALLNERYSYKRYAKVLMYVILFEGMWGIMQRGLAQVILGRNDGDIVEGTINPLSFIQGHSGFSNQFFAMNMVFFLVFCFPFVASSGSLKAKLASAIGLLALVFASVGHVFYSLLLAIVVTYIVFEAHRILLSAKTLFVFLIAGGGMLLLLSQLDPDIYYGAQRQALMFLEGDSPKAKAVQIAFNEVGKEYPLMHLLGVGPGQYASRAGIIASGTYGGLSDFFTSIPVLNVGATELFDRYIRSTWVYVQNNIEAFGNSTMYRPFFSLLSVYVEFGGIVFFLMLFTVVSQVFRLRKKYYQLKDKKQLRLLCFCCSSAILFLFFIGLYENYYETSQGIFVGILLILVMHSIIRTAVSKISKAPNETNHSQKERATVAG
uniref:O-antigen ligase family protein n=1 Tax=Roseihalotalea indica TaxID=2867963 RepID=A0AA49JK24_9BACT|nr:hypothetical protein K4G66_15380 [Tunicatimonas sp. TK19036]